MPTPQNVTQLPCWKIRIVIPGAMIHVSSATEPAIKINSTGRVESLDWTPIIDGADAGDALGFIRWEEAVTISWRKSTPPAEAKTSTAATKATIPKELIERLTMEAALKECEGVNELLRRIADRSLILWTRKDSERAWAALTGKSKQ